MSEKDRVLDLESLLTALKKAGQAAMGEKPSLAMRHAQWLRVVTAVMMLGVLQRSEGTVSPRTFVSRFVELGIRNSIRDLVTTVYILCGDPLKDSLTQDLKDFDDTDVPFYLALRQGLLPNQPT